jgi:hypothetical protein
VTAASVVQSVGSDPMPPCSLHESTGLLAAIEGHEPRLGPAMERVSPEPLRKGEALRVNLVKRAGNAEGRSHDGDHRVHWGRKFPERANPMLPMAAPSILRRALERTVEVAWGNRVPCMAGRWERPFRLHWPGIIASRALPPER